MWCSGEKLVWPPTNLELLVSYTASSGALLLSSGLRRGGWRRCSWVVGMAHMLKDLVDYFKLEEINIDNWTFKLYYKVFCINMWPKYRKKLIGLAFVLILSSLSEHQYRIRKTVATINFKLTDQWWLASISVNICQTAKLCFSMSGRPKGSSVLNKQQILFHCWQKSWLWISDNILIVDYFRSLWWYAWPEQPLALPASTLVIPSGDKKRWKSWLEEKRPIWTFTIWADLSASSWVGCWCIAFALLPSVH